MIQSINTILELFFYSLFYFALFVFFSQKYTGSIHEIRRFLSMEKTGRYTNQDLQSKIKKLEDGISYYKRLSIYAYTITFISHLIYIVGFHKEWLSKLFYSMIVFAIASVFQIMIYLMRGRGTIHSNYPSGGGFFRRL